MFLRSLILKFAIVAFLVLATAETARPQQINYHYVRANDSNFMTYSPRPSFAYIRGRVYYFSPSPQPDPPPPNTWLEFRHPYTHAYVTVPVNLPNGVPHIEYRGDRVIYNYGVYAVVIHFVHGGSVDVTYQNRN